MQGIVTAPREVGVDRDQILHLADLAREYDAVPAETDFLRFGGAGQSRG